MARDLDVSALCGAHPAASRASMQAAAAAVDSRLGRSIKRTAGTSRQLKPATLAVVGQSPGSNSSRRGPGCLAVSQLCEAIGYPEVS